MKKTYQTEYQRLTLSPNWSPREPEQGHVVFVREDYPHYVTCGPDKTRQRLTVLLDDTSEKYPKPIAHIEGKRKYELGHVSECINISHNLVSPSLDALGSYSGEETEPTVERFD